MKNGAVKIFVSIAAVAAGFALIFVLSGFLDKHRPPLPEGHEDQDLALQGAKLKGYALGFEGLIADWYWMQSLQYIGNKILKSEEQISIDDLKPLNPRLLYPLLDNATTLDPHFVEVYAYGATVLPAIDAEKAIQFAEKGIRDNPDQWRLYHLLGYIHWRLKNYERAAEVYEKGSKISGAPRFMHLMAAQIRTQGGSRATARVMYEQMLREAPDTQTREAAEYRLRELDSFDEQEAIGAALKSFQERNNRCVNSLTELFPLLRGVRLPGGRNFQLDESNSIVDPSGEPYELDTKNCQVKPGRNSRFPQPEKL